MFLKVFQPAIKRKTTDIDQLSKVCRWAFTGHHMTKRNAGHSEWANRKGIREANSIKKTSAVNRFKLQIAKAVLQEKSANPALNPKLHAVLSEARRASISQAILDKILKPLAAALSQENIHSFTFSHPLGITYIVDISSIQPIEAKARISSVMKKFGFQFEGLSSVTHKVTGIISATKSDNTEVGHDKAVEDAIEANCEEVDLSDDGNLIFICHPQNIETCSKSLSNLGYTVNYTEKQYEFPAYTQIDDAIRQRLEQMEEKLGNIPGFVKVISNVE